MKITTYQVEEYKKCPIYYRNLKYHFEYLTIVKGQLYTAHLSVIPTFINRLLYWLKLEKTYYSQQQTKKILFQLRQMAETTIEFVLDESNKK